MSDDNESIVQVNWSGRLRLSFSEYPIVCFVHTDNYLFETYLELNSSVIDGELTCSNPP